MSSISSEVCRNKLLLQIKIKIDLILELCVIRFRIFEVDRNFYAKEKLQTVPLFPNEQICLVLEDN